jgi:hypothetical protein
MHFLLKLLFTIILTNCNAIDDLINKYGSKLNMTNSEDFEKQLKDNIIGSISKSLDKISSNSSFMNQYANNKDIIENIYAEVKKFNISNNLTDLEQIISSYQMLNELNISEETVKINKMLEGMKKMVGYIKENNIDLKIPEIAEFLKENYLTEKEEEEEEEVKEQTCTPDQCLLDGKCVKKIYCEKLSEWENKSNTIYYIIVSVLGLLIVLFILYKIKYRVTNTQIEYIPHNKEDESFA